MARSGIIGAQRHGLEARASIGADFGPIFEGMQEAIVR
jgi:hypothetical protein